MSQNSFNPSDVVRRGEELYEREIRAHVEPEHIGEFLALDVETGEYEIDADESAAILRAVAKHPDRAATRYILRIGYRAAHKIGGTLSVRGR